MQALAKENHRTPGKNYNTKNNKAIERGTRNAYTTTLRFSSLNIANFITHAKNETRPRSSDNSIPVHNRSVSQTVHETSKILHGLRITDHLFYMKTKSTPLSRQRIIRASTTPTSTYATYLCTTKQATTFTEQAVERATAAYSPIPRCFLKEGKREFFRAQPFLPAAVLNLTPP